jgi:hypothetical protein
MEGMERGKKTWTKSLRKKEKISGQDHPQTLASMSYLKTINRYLVLWKDAYDLEVHLVIIATRVFGDDRPDTMTCQSNFSMTLMKLGKRKKVEEIKMQVLETRINNFGLSHPDTMTSVQILLDQ